MDPTKRRLPVLKADPPGGGEEPRPPWHWVAFGVVAMFAVWLPLASAAEAFKARRIEAWVGAPGSPEAALAAVAALAPGERARLYAVILGPHAAALALAALAAGLLVGRFGEGAGPREAALAGLAAIGVVVVLAVSSGAPAATALAAVPAALLAASVAGLGARLGKRRPAA